MASVYKRSQDRGKKRAIWYIGWTDQLGIRRTTKGFTDKQQSERLGAKLEHEARLRALGLIDPEAERMAGQRNAPFEEHLAAFKVSLSGNSPKHIKLVMSRIELIVTKCNYRTAVEISMENVRAAVELIAAEKKLGHRTYNHYVQAFDEFCKWLVVSKRILTNPIHGLERRNNEVDVRHRRRALTAVEFGMLVTSARTSDETIQCYDGETRARLYILTYMTGLRRNEIGSLTPRSFDLKAELPTLTVEAAFSKHRRRDVLPLHPELVAMLPIWLHPFAPDEVIFPKVAERKTWLMVKKDLKRVGIPYKNHDGVADFHAAGRHTHITELLRNGATLPEARQLARHSDVKMTMRYTHIGIEDQAKALRQLPWKVESEGEGSSASTEGNRNRECSGSEPGGRSSLEESNAGFQNGGADRSIRDLTRAADATCRVVSSLGHSPRKPSHGFDSRRLHFSQKEALRRECRRALSFRQRVPSTRASTGSISLPIIPVL